jgi:TatD DNase family protein
LLDLGLFLSLSGIVTFKSAQELREVARFTPLEQLLIETDCPLLAPVPYRGKRNEPAYVVHVGKTIAEAKGIPLAEVAEATRQNTDRLFRLAE